MWSVIPSRNHMKCVPFCRSAETPKNLFNATGNGFHGPMCAIPSKTPMELPTAQRRFCWCWRTNLSTIDQKYSSDALQNSDKRRNQPRKFSLGLPPLTSYQRGQHICDILAHTSMSSQSGFPLSTYPCGAPRCRKCIHVSATTIIEGPRHNQEAFHL